MPGILFRGCDSSPACGFGRVYLGFGRFVSVCVTAVLEDERRMLLRVGAESGLFGRSSCSSVLCADPGAACVAFFLSLI